MMEFFSVELANDVEQPAFQHAIKKRSGSLWHTLTFRLLRPEVLLRRSFDVILQKMKVFGLWTFFFGKK